MSTKHHHRLSLLAVAVAAVALTGCDDDGSSRSSISLTTENAPFVAADVAGVVGGIEEIGEAGPAGLKGVVARARAAREAVACAAGGTSEYFETESTWGTTYRNCTSVEGSDPDNQYRVVYNGTVEGAETMYGGLYIYSNYRVAAQATDDGELVYRYSESLDGTVEYQEFGPGYGGYNNVGGERYITDGLSVKRSLFEEDGLLMPTAVDSDDLNESSSVYYDEFDVTFSSYGGYEYWNGIVKADASGLGITTVESDGWFGVNYNCPTVYGGLWITGRLVDDGEDEVPTGNFLYLSSVGGPFVSYSLYTKDEELISSYTYNWFEYDPDANYEYCE